MEHIIKKFGFINEEQFLSVTKTLSNVCGTNLNKTRYKFVKEKGFQTVKSYLQALNKETAPKNSIEYQDIDEIMFNSFEKDNFKKERKIIYFTETSIILETPISKSPVETAFDIESVTESMSEYWSGTDLLINTKITPTIYSDIFVFSGEFCYNDLLENNINLDTFSECINSAFGTDSCFELYIDYLSSKVDPGYIGLSDDIINYPAFKRFENNIDYKYKKAISNAFFWSRGLGRQTQYELMEHRKQFLKNLTIQAITKNNELFQLF